jgi:hypothetical protein
VLATWLLLLVIAAELVARAGMGLGDPPLYMADPDIEYLAVPGEYRPGGQRVAINIHSMRSDPITPRRPDSAEFRILFLGGGVLHGGDWLDQDALATEQLATSLTGALDRPVIVANAAAPRWGPAHLLAYVERFGTFDADLAVIVLSGDDLARMPDYRWPKPGLPTSPPMLAAERLWHDHIAAYLPQLAGPAPAGLGQRRPAGGDADRSLAALASLLDRLHEQGLEVIVTLHPTQGELAGRPGEGWQGIESAADRQGVTVLDLTEAYRAAVNRGERLYHDPVHLTAAGQRTLAAALAEGIEKAAHAAAPSPTNGVDRADQPPPDDDGRADNGSDEPAGR